MTRVGLRLLYAATALVATSAAASERELIIPMAGLRASDLVDSWDKSRAEGRVHHAIDIQAPIGTPVLAAMDGTIEKLFASKRGGLTIYQRSADGKRILYYAHLLGYRRGLAEGQPVRLGQVIGTVGASGNADPAFPHLHFQILETRPGSGWQDGEPVNPYPLLTGKRGPG